tara:strand:- start:11631 stop:12059 length:429 start_codon:yes stop_codon:yes gene_type:complete
MDRIKIYFFTFLLAFFFTKEAISKDNYFSEAEKLFNNKKYLESKFKFEKDIVFNPKNEKSYLYLAKIFNEEKNELMEEQNLNTVILLNPQNEEAIFLLTLLKIKKSDYSESEKLIRNFKKVCKTLCNKDKELQIKLESLQPK